jgi:glycosyltransferase involved in cell wall biosynthesis
MPAHNVAPFVGVAIESVMAQTFDDWELIVIDDGSVDTTAAVVERYLSRDARLKLVRQPNRGISGARNTAMRIADGEYIALLDSDDLWEPAFLDAQVAILRTRPDIDILTANAWNMGGHADGEPARPWPDPRPQPTLATIIADETAVFIMSVMRRRVFETVGPFDENLRTNEDYDYWLRAAAAGFRFARNARPLARYRRRSDSASASDVRMLHGILRVYAKVRPLLDGRPDEIAVLDAQVARFEAERLRAEAREAMDDGDVGRAGDRLAALYAARGGAFIAVASLMARWAPTLFSRAYRIRRARQEAAS